MANFQCMTSSIDLHSMQMLPSYGDSRAREQRRPRSNTTHSKFVERRPSTRTYNNEMALCKVHHDVNLGMRCLLWRFRQVLHQRSPFLVILSLAVVHQKTSRGLTFALQFNDILLLEPRVTNDALLARSNKGICTRFTRHMPAGFRYLFRRHGSACFWRAVVLGTHGIE